MSGQHARLSASSAHRWLVCPGSVAPGGASSVYAAQGTFAHDIAAKCLADDSLSPSDFLLQKAVIDGHEVECDFEMVDAINTYLAAIDDDRMEGDQYWIEMSLIEPLSKIDPDLGGTADYVRYRPSTKSLRVFDFKFGSGVFVDADSNEQMQLYALGAMLQVNAPVEEVEVTVVQPRFEGADPVRSWKFKASAILDFMADVRDAAAGTRKTNPPLVAGDHCKFCPKAKDCPELTAKQNALLAAEFGPAVPYDVDALTKALNSVALVKAKIKALEEFAYAEAMRGVEIPDWKLVEKRPARRWKSDGDTIEWAQGKGLDPFAPRELLSPAQMEARLKESLPRGQKKAAAEAVAHLVEKVSSGLALVPATDDRAPVRQITGADFAALT